MADINNITQASHPLIGDSSLAARPHGDQAVPANIVPPISPHVEPPLAPADLTQLMYLDIDRKSEPELRYLNSNANIADIRYRDGSDI